MTRPHVRFPLAALLAGLLPAQAPAAEDQGPAPTDEKPAAESAAQPAESAADPAFREIDAFIGAQEIDRSGSRWKTRLAKPPKVTFDPAAKYYWDLETNVGPLVIQLLPDVAPMHVSSTIYLTRLGFYDRTRFHRVIPDFMAQGGDPLGNGTGGPGYEYAGEFSPSLRHDKRGQLSMANRGPGTDGSQFFLTFKATPWLDGKHTLFGEVVGGTATLDKLEKAGTPSGRPTGSLEIVKATVRRETAPE